jgi:hypothetical protein
MVVGKIVLNVASARSSAREAEVKHAAERPKGHPLSELGWTKEQTAEARRRVAGLEYLWDDPSMDAYDDL